MTIFIQIYFILCSQIEGIQDSGAPIPMLWMPYQEPHSFSYQALLNSPIPYLISDEQQTPSIPDDGKDGVNI